MTEKAKAAVLRDAWHSDYRQAGLPEIGRDARENRCCEREYGLRYYRSCAQLAPRRTARDGPEIGEFVRGRA